MKTSCFKIFCRFFSTKDIYNILKENRCRFEGNLKKVCVVGVGDGRCTAEMEVCPEHLDASKNMHPGMTATLIDSFTSFALLSHKSHEGIESQPVDMYITFFHTPTCGDVITIEGDCLKVGPRLAFTSCTITNKCNGTLLALAAHTKYYVRKL
ncbi:hypothetical protein FQR65_LT19728 [Abscondita terminalis]|nr:hypothetical protein FQR65_LT19728 [Abscondita terminalis]